MKILIILKNLDLKLLFISITTTLICIETRTTLPQRYLQQTLWNRINMLRLFLEINHNLYDHLKNIGKKKNCLILFYINVINIINYNL